jgi:hypothetical protein
MGRFVNLMIAKHPERPAFVAEVARALQRRRVTMHDRKPASYDDEMREYDSKNGWSYLHFRWATWDYEGVVKEVSRALETPVFFFQIYDGDYWTYHLYDSGELVGKFSSVLDYWDTPWDPVEWSGNLPEVESLLGVQDPRLPKYLRHISGEEGKIKVDPADASDLKDPWVMRDFIKRLGLDYPEDEVPIATQYLKLDRRPTESKG